MRSNLASSHENLLLGNLPHGELKLFSIFAKSLLDSVCSSSQSNIVNNHIINSKLHRTKEMVVKMRAMNGLVNH